MSYLKTKNAEFIASIPQPPVMPICHGPSDLNALAEHVEEVTRLFADYVFSLAREASSLNVNTQPSLVSEAIHGAMHDSDLCQAIRDEAEMMVERVAEDA